MPQSKYHYCYWHAPLQKWYSRIRFRGKLYHLGFFMSEDEAKVVLDETLCKIGLASTSEELYAKRTSRTRTKAIDRLLEEAAQAQKPPDKPTSPDDRIGSVFDD